MILHTFGVEVVAKVLSVFCETLGEILVLSPKP